MEKYGELDFLAVRPKSMEKYDTNSVKCNIVKGSEKSNKS
jgi:hypothetical protein